jgi:hypothetical protein
MHAIQAQSMRAELGSELVAEYRRELNRLNAARENACARAARLSASRSASCPRASLSRSSSPGILPAFS